MLHYSPEVQRFSSPSRGRVRPGAYFIHPDSIIDISYTIISIRPYELSIEWPIPDLTLTIIQRCNPRALRNEGVLGAGFLHTLLTHILHVSFILISIRVQLKHLSGTPIHDSRFEPPKVPHSGSICGGRMGPDAYLIQS